MIVGGPVAPEVTAGPEPSGQVKPEPSANETVVLRVPHSPHPAEPHGERTVVLRPARTPGEQTVVLHPPQAPPPAETPGEQTAVLQVPPSAGTPGEQTALLRPPQTPPSPGEETVVLRVPGKVVGEDATVEIRPARADETLILPASVAPPPAVTKPLSIPVISPPPVVPGPMRAPRRTIPAKAKAKAKTNPGRVQASASSTGLKTERRKITRGAFDLGRRREPRGGPYDLGHAPAVLLLSSLGVLLVALSYAGGRNGTDGSTIAYWIGQVVVFTPVVLRLLSRRMAGVAESFMLVIGLAVNQYLLKWMYSPDQFRFPDELQHWLATTIVVDTGELFQPNPALPPAVHFPALAEMGAAVSGMTGLPVTAAGILVAGVAHLVFVGVLFVVVLRASNSPAVAGVACATYATALHYLFFNSMFLYQTAALPFFMLTIWATRRWREGGGWPFAFLAVAAIGLTTVSHHVTALALIATLLLLALAELATERPRRWAALIMPGAALVVVAAWILLVARDVIGYLEAPIDQVMDTLSMLVSDRASAASTTAAVSIGQLAVQGLGLFGLFILYFAVGRDMVLRRDRDSWRWAALVGGAIFFLGNGVRFIGQNGPEIAGRLSTFTYVPMSIIAAIALVRAVQIIPTRDDEGRRWWVSPALEVPPPKGRNLVVRVVAGSALVTLLMIGARTGGWPPIGSLLPGSYLAGGFERSVDAYGVDAANWQRTTLGPGNRVGGDVTSVSLASTYGRQDPVREVGALYYATRWTLADDDAVTALNLQYLVVDRRLSNQLPVSEAYFEDDPQAGRITRPLSAVQLGKFDALTDVDRLYDNGSVRIYRMGEQ